jgi:hypothetical protein
MASPVVTEFGGFGVTSTQLQALNELGKDENNKAQLVALGGVEGVSRLLHVDHVKGNSGSAEDVSARQTAFGKNEVPDPPFESWFSLFLGSFDDFVLKILMVAAVVSIVIGSIPQIAEGHTPEEKEKEAKIAWIDGFA